MNADGIEIALADEAATEALGRWLAAVAAPGDVIALAGDLGSGKTVLARAVVRAYCDTPGEEVPSPTFTLVQSYEGGAAPVHHFDLYRLEDPDEALELGIEEAFADGVTLIEWPDRLGPWLPAERLD
ncbi:MAG: tRNA (adenosine(37)-N6)-threonylcarbamoyltransferase complex ATPase subunit type 1 TsaE, partial [Rhodospirillaceae bacterium]